MQTLQFCIAEFRKKFVIIIIFVQISVFKRLFIFCQKRKSTEATAVTPPSKRARVAPGPAAAQEKTKQSPPKTAEASTSHEECLYKRGEYLAVRNATGLLTSLEIFS